MRIGPIFSALPSLSFALLMARVATAACPDAAWQEEEGEECDDGNAAPGDGCSADCQVECTEVGGAATAHTCLHGGFGPFKSELAQVYPGFVYTDISAPHTYFTLALPGEAGVDRHGVIFYPTASGDFAIYMKSQFPLVLRDSTTGDAVPVFIEHAIGSCSVADSITWVKTFKGLSDQVEYILEIGPTAQTTVSVALEYLPSFSRFWHRDSDRDGFGGELIGQSWCVAPDAYPPDGEDCDDTNVEVHPDAHETCNGLDDDCNFMPDGDTAGLCDSDEAGRVCLDTRSSGRCGCQTNADCGAERSCNLAAHRCEAPSSGAGGSGAGGEASAGATGDAGAGGEQPAFGAGGEPSSEPATAGSSGKVNDGGSATGGSGAGGSAMATGDGGKPSGSKDEDERNSGCQIGRSPSSSGWLWLAAALAALLRRRPAQ